MEEEVGRGKGAKGEGGGNGRYQVATDLINFSGWPGQASASVGRKHDVFLFLSFL